MADIFDEVATTPKDVFDEVSEPLDFSKSLAKPGQLDAQGNKPYAGYLSGGPFSAYQPQNMQEAVDLYKSLGDPAIAIPRIKGTSTIGKLAAAPVNVASGLLEGFESPVGLAATAVGGPVVKGLFAGLAAKEAGRALGEASVTKDPQSIAEGVLGAGSAPWMALHGTLERPKPTINENQIQSTSRVPVEQQSVPVERPTESQAQVGTPQRTSEGEQALPQPAEVSKEVEQSIQEAAEPVEAKAGLDDVIQMLEDSIATKKSNGDKVPQQYIDRLGELKARKAGETPPVNELFSDETVPGHPFNSDEPVLPIRIKVSPQSLESLQGRWQQAQDRIEDARVKLRTAKGGNKPGLEVEIDNMKSAQKELGRMMRLMESKLSEAPPSAETGEAKPSAAPVSGAVEPSVAADPVQQGYVRMYHGGSDPRGDLNGPRDITQYYDYAKGYADKSGSPVWYVDVPQDAAYMKKGFEEFEGGPKAPWINTVAPADVMSKAKPVAAEGTPQAITKPTGEPEVAQGGEQLPLVGMGGAVPAEFTESPGADIYGIAQRVREERSGAGQTPAIQPGQGVSDVQAVVHGRTLLKADPLAAQKAVDAFTKTKAISYDAIATVRAKGEEASLAARRIEEKFGTDSPEYRNAFENLARWDKASKEMQTEWHKSGMAQQGQTDIDTGTFTGLQRAFTEATGRTFDKGQERTAKDLASKSQKADADVVQAKDKLFKTLDVGEVDPKVQSLADRIVATLDKGASDALARIKARRAQGRLFTGIDPEALADYAIYGAAKIAKGAVEFSKWSAEMVGEIGDYITPHLKQIWEASNKHLDSEVAKVGPEAEAVKQAVRKTPNTVDAVRSKLAEREAGQPFTLDQVKAIWNYAKEHYLAKGINDFTDVVQGIATDLGMKPEEVRRALAQPKGAKRMSDEMYAKMAEQRRIQQTAKAWVRDQQVPGWLRFMRSVPRIFFIDKIFGHGTVGMITHAGLNIFNPAAWKTYWPAFFKQYGLVFKPAYHERLMQELARDPLYITARRAGLANDPWRYSDDYQNAAIKTFMGKLGGLVGNRGFDALKLFRQARFNQIWNGLPEALKTPQMARIYADSINHATGVVATPFREWTGWAFFAPKLEASRWAWMLADPARAAKTFKEWKTASSEEKAFAMSEFKQKAAIAGTYFGLLAANQGILSSSGSKQKVNFTNPRKGDFLAFKVDGHNIGVVSPMLGMVRLFANLYHDAIGKRSPLEKLTPRGSSIAEDVGSYARGKLSPFAGQVFNLASQSDFQGRPLPFSKDRVPAYLRKRGIGRYGYGEYIAQELAPIPVEEALKEVWSKQGMSETEIQKYLTALTIALAAGGTGARVSRDYNVK